MLYTAAYTPVISQKKVIRDLLFYINSQHGRVIQLHPIIFIYRCVYFFNSTYFSVVVFSIIIICVCEVLLAPWHVPWCVSMVCEDALLKAERMCACPHKVLPGVIAHNRLKDPDKIQSVKWQGQACSCSATDPETWGEERRRAERDGG